MQHVHCCRPWNGTSQAVAQPWHRATWSTDFCHSNHTNKHLSQPHQLQIPCNALITVLNTLNPLRNCPGSSKGKSQLLPWSHSYYHNQATPNFRSLRVHGVSKFLSCPVDRCAVRALMETSKGPPRPLLAHGMVQQDILADLIHTLNTE